MTAIKLRRQLIPEGIQEKFVTVLGHRLRFLTGGSGPPLVLLSGLMGFSFSFSENLAELAKHATVYAPDLLNTGYSDRAEINTTLAGIADEVAKFMSAVGIRRADILGSSHGGSVAMVLAVKSPDRVARLVLVSPANPWSEHRRLTISLFPGGIGRTISPIVRFMPTIAVRFFIARIYHDPNRMLPGTVEGYSQPLKNPQTLRYFLDAAKSWYRDFNDLHTVFVSLRKVPSLLVWGTHDPVVSLDSGKAMLEHLQSAALVTLDSGHLPYEEQPEEFNQAVIDFLLGRK